MTPTAKRIAKKVRRFFLRVGMEKMRLRRWWYHRVAKKFLQ